VLIGRSIVGFQTGDIIRVVNYLETLYDVDNAKIGGLAVGEMGSAFCMLLHLNHQ